MNEKLVKQWKSFVERLEEAKRSLSDFSGGLHNVSEDKTATNGAGLDDLGTVSSDNGASIDNIAGTLSELSSTLDDLASTVSELAEKVKANG